MHICGMSDATHDPKVNGRPMVLYSKDIDPRRRRKSGSWSVCINGTALRTNSSLETNDRQILIQGPGGNGGGEGKAEIQPYIQAARLNRPVTVSARPGDSPVWGSCRRLRRMGVDGATGRPSVTSPPLPPQPEPELQAGPGADAGGRRQSDVSAPQEPTASRSTGGADEASGLVMRGRFAGGGQGGGGPVI